MLITLLYQLAASGGTSGDQAAYIPAFSASISDSSGDVSAATIVAPTALSGSAQLVSLQLFGSAISTNTANYFTSGHSKWSWRL